MVWVENFASVDLSGPVAILVVSANDSVLNLVFSFLKTSLDNCSMVWVENFASVDLSGPVAILVVFTPACLSTPQAQRSPACVLPEAFSLRTCCSRSALQTCLHIRRTGPLLQQNLLRVPLVAFLSDIPQCIRSCYCLL